MILIYCGFLLNIQWSNTHFWSFISFPSAHAMSRLHEISGGQRTCRVANGRGHLLWVCRVRAADCDSDSPWTRHLTHSEVTRLQGRERSAELFHGLDSPSFLSAPLTSLTTVWRRRLSLWFQSISLYLMVCHSLVVRADIVVWTWVYVHVFGEELPRNNSTSHACSYSVDFHWPL